MPQWTDFKALANRTLKGTMADTPCRGFQWEYRVLDVFDQTELGFGSQTATAKLRVQILTSDEATILFDSTIEVKYTLVTLDFGGMTLFTWWVDHQNAKITTTVPETFSMIGVEQLYFTTDSEMSSMTDNDCIVQFDLFSGKYLIPLPAGAIFKVKFHNAGMSGLTFSPVLTSVLPGGGLSGARLAQDGMTRLVVPVSDGLQFNAGCDLRGLVHSAPNAWPHSTAPAPTSPQVSSIIPDSNGAGSYLLFYLRKVTPWVVYEAGGGLWLAESFSDGRDWEAPMRLATGVSLLGGDIGGDGGTLYLLGVRGSTPVLLICSSERDEAGNSVLRVTSEITPVGLPSMSAGLGFFKVQGGVFRFVHDASSGLDYYESTDGGRTWQ